MKRGITLISLGITVIILLIILSSVVVGTSTIINKSKKTAFSKDLKTIEDAVSIEYNTNGILPVVSGTTYTVEQVKAMVTDTSNLATLVTELTENNDTGSTFYKIDLSKIGIKNSKRGTEADGNVKDIYLVSDNLKVYYPIGLKVSGNIYFSITSALVKGSKISINADEGTGDSATVLANGIKLTKNKEIWTNEIIITVNTTKNVGDVIKYSIAGQTQKIAATDIITLNSSTLTTDEKTALITVANKQVVVKRYNSSNTELATVTMEIKNLDIEVPTAGAAAPTLVSTVDTNTLTFTSMLDTGGSGIKELRYEYVTKLDSSNTYSNFYTPQPTITATYMKNIGKKSSDVNVILLPKNIRTISVVWIDNAGNISGITSYTIPLENLVKEEGETIPPYVGTLTSLVITMGGAKIQVTINSAADDSGIKEYDFYLNNNKIITQASNIYTYISLNTYTSYTIKYVARDNKNNTSTSIDYIITTAGSQSGGGGGS